jgi:hypothetical protein
VSQIIRATGNVKRAAGRIPSQAVEAARHNLEDLGLTGSLSGDVENENVFVGCFAVNLSVGIEVLVETAGKNLQGVSVRAKCGSHRHVYAEIGESGQAGIQLTESACRVARAE